MASDLIDLVSDVGGPLLLVLTLLIVFAESAVLLDVLVPGEVGLVVAGAAAAEADLPLSSLVLVAALGALLGDSSGYWLGRRFGPVGATRWRWARAHVEPRLARARHHFDRRGGVTVAVARWVGALRAVVPLVAGAAGLPFRVFVAWDAPSALAWAAVVGGLGYHLGDDVAEVVDRASGLLTAVVVVGLVVWFLVRRRQAAIDDASSGRM